MIAVLKLEVSKMKKENNLIEVLKLVQNSCEHYSCNACIFAIHYGCKCALRGIPMDWELDEVNDDIR